ncbi:hypothetical protein [Prosthecomicrobium sp. N25]|uniref:hypothetical protein n=1 Tax=Prosthecomicrobium sp. N25 TaxID=3129254 RepID=UPI003076A126
MTSLRLKVVRALACTALAGLAAAPVQAAGVTNGDFATNDMTGWTINFGTVDASSGRATIGNSGSGGFAGLFSQALSLAAGWYNVSFDYKVTGSSLGTWGVTAGGTTLANFGGTLFAPSSGTNSGSFYSNGVQSVLLSAGAFGFGGPTSSVSFDNFSLSAASVPGPVAGAALPLLAGFGGFMAWRRRRARAATA